MRDLEKLKIKRERPANEEPLTGETSAVVYGVALAVPMLLCCALPLLLAAGIGTVTGAAGSWLAGLGGIEVAAGAVVAGAAGFALVRWRRMRLRGCGGLAT